MTGAPNDKRGNREQEISSISRALKSLAKELHVPVIALAQLSRAVESRGGEKRPMLSDLRESGAIEQDADIVTFIYRPGYYGVDDKMDHPQDLAEIIVAKHRNGGLGTVNLRFIDQYVKFTDPEEVFGNDFMKDDFNANPFATMTRPSKLNTFDVDNDDLFNASNPDDESSIIPF
jgi:replicative DNA helicase